jgi:transposase-like protein
MEKEVRDLRAAIETWKSNPAPGRKAYPVEIKQNAIAMLRKHSPSLLAKQLGICVSMLYAWRAFLQREGLSVETFKVVAPSDPIFPATKVLLPQVGPKRSESAMVAKIRFGNASIEIHSADALVSVCESLAGRQS